MRLVARGFTQQPRMDYNETYSPIVRLETICAIIAQAVKEDWEIQQMDVKGTYLNGILKEEVYMMQPEGFNDGTWRLCWLIKTLYGLKQLGCKWNEEFNQKLIQQDFTRLHSDPCVYIRHKTGNIKIITVWVDDLLLFTNMPDIMRHLKVELHNLFKITNMGESSKIVGIKIEHDPENKTISIRQVQYINSILQKWGMNKANKVAMPIDPHLKLESSINDTPSKSTPYALLIALLMYAAVATHPDIAYTVS